MLSGKRNTKSYDSLFQRLFQGRCHNKNLRLSPNRTFLLTVLYCTYQPQTNTQHITLMTGYARAHKAKPRGTMSQQTILYGPEGEVAAAASQQNALPTGVDGAESPGTVTDYSGDNMTGFSICLSVCLCVSTHLAGCVAMLAPGPC